MLTKQERLELRDWRLEFQNMSYLFRKENEYLEALSKIVHESDQNLMILDHHQIRRYFRTGHISENSRAFRTPGRHWWCSKGH